MALLPYWNASGGGQYSLRKYFKAARSHWYISSKYCVNMAAIAVAIFTLRAIP